jgi:ABC transporter substrate binding protein (PQQ-dependent alcohol dehydrogenase system)
MIMNIRCLIGFFMLAFSVSGLAAMKSKTLATTPAGQSSPTTTAPSSTGRSNSAEKTAKSTAQTAAKQIVKIVYFTQRTTPPPAMSNLDPFVVDKGDLGADLAINDNNTTGQFTQQHYELIKVIVPVDADPVAVFNNQLPNDAELVVLNVSADLLAKLQDQPAAKNRLLFDAATSDDESRAAGCRSAVLHMMPSRAMRADALGQYLLKKRWQKWLLVVGQNPEDQLYAAAIKRAAKRFNHKIVAEKVWSNDFDSRRTAQADVPVFTQGEDYDVLVVADERGWFGEYFDYRSWLPRPVVGTQGLIATAWHPSHENWGATQLQNRFREQSGRWMQETDYGVYLAVRAIGEASVRSKSNRQSVIRDYMFSDHFALQAYKGMPLSFRAWDGQLRQPVLLAAPRAMVAVAPVEGFLHPKSELDTLGYDQAESACHFSP